ncbi:MAG: ROK family protein, partial [Chloroflexi bacterium]|nr:ROK family protein [Chloroflexota bacterium]
IGIDIGGTDTKLGLVDSYGAIRQFQRFPSDTSGDPQPFLREMVERIGQLCDLGRDQVCGIGLSVHGYVDAERRGPIVAPNTSGLCGLDLRGLLEGAFALPVVVNADLTAHVLAEYHYGSGRGSHRFLCLAVGTGLGAGVVVNGEALRYLGGCAGDTGHVIIQPDGPRCSMGCRGCAEALCGVSGIERLARERLGRDVPAHEIITGARAGEPLCVTIIEQIGAWLGQTLATLCSIYLPDRVALSGGVSEAGPALLAACERRFHELVGDYHKQAVALSGQFYTGVTFVLAEMRGQTGLVGAVAELFLRRGLQNG